jgi:hypothetical protein
MKPQGHFKERRQKGLSLEAFAGAKKSTYDKIAKDNKAFNLNAKKVKHSENARWHTPQRGFQHHAFPGAFTNRRFARHPLAL